MGLLFAAMRRCFVIIIVLTLLTACGEEMANISVTRLVLPSPSAVPSRTPPVTLTAGPSPTATETPTSTPLPTVTPTPTPAAVPIMISGDPRAVVLREPVADGNAPCGRVDLFDFPLDPPHAQSTSAGVDFGVYRGRFSKYHAGEDWWFSRGGSSLGKPVFSIGHGLVTYAQPLGWGRDQGVVIVRHTYEDGSNVLSFYGHLDPDSVVLTAGRCVARGEQVGKIGKPRSSPHLHFEVRTHLPYTPGTGYWEEDPTVAGWLPPSQTIWNGRLAVAPGVQWSESFASPAVKGIGLFDEELFIAVEDDQLLGIDMADGMVSWTLQSENDVEDAALNDGKGLIYIAGQLGEIEAYGWPDSPGGSETSAPTALWTADLDVVGKPVLMPLSGGGIVASIWDRLFAISAAGDLLWEREGVGRPFDWLVSEDALLLTTKGGESSLWSASEAGLLSWAEPVIGQLAPDGERVLLLDTDALYELQPGSRSVEKLISLPQGAAELGSVTALPGEGLLLVHSDRADRRLMALDDEGSLLWERSIASILDGEPRLLVQEDQAYLVILDRSSGLNDVAIYAIDLEQEDLALLFEGGTRSAVTNHSGVYGIGEELILVNIGGRSLTAVDLGLANEIRGND